MYIHGEKLTILDPSSTFIDERAVIGNDVTVYERVRIEGTCVIGDGCVIMPDCYIRDSTLGRGVRVDASRIENARLGDNVTVGPYAHLRPGALIDTGARIGNFVEIKNAHIGEGTKVNHLAYVGDADVGRGCNIGCGAIFVNYNGRTKSRSTVEDNCFIGSNCNIIAPVTVRRNSYICAGTTVCEDTEEGDFLIGRARQIAKRGRAYESLKEVY